MAAERRPPSPDLFDDVLNVESRLHDAGYNDGLKDGNQAGIIEGRGFGLQKGFEKFLESGRFAGKAIVWANRLPRKTANIEDETQSEKTPATALPPLPNNARLEKNIDSLYTLVDPKVLSLENSDASVQDFDDRLKKAEGKARIIDRVVGASSKASS